MNDSPHFVLSKTPSIANRFLAELRDVSVQQDRMRFRRNLERIGEILAYELSKTLNYQEQQVSTPLNIHTTPLPMHTPVLVSILRAGLPLHQGVLNYFDQADNGFIGAYRNVDEDDEQGFSIQLDYESLPSIQDRPLILIDPMLASGRTLGKNPQRNYCLRCPFSDPHRSCHCSSRRYRLFGKGQFSALYFVDWGH